MMELTIRNVSKTYPGGRLLAVFALALAAIATAAGLVLGGVIFFNTNVLHDLDGGRTPLLPLRHRWPRPERPSLLFGPLRRAERP
jgi:hypothetical protein